MAKFKVGDKVRYLGGNWFDTGETLTVVENDESDYMPIRAEGAKDTNWICATEIELISQKPTKKQRIKALEAEVAELKAKVEAYEKAQATPKTIPVTTDNIAVGDKILVVDAGEIGGGCDLTSGNVYVVTEVDGEGCPYVRDDVADSLYISSDEFHAIEKVVSE